MVNIGASVIVLDNFKSGSIDNLSNILHSTRLIKGDVRNYETVKQSVKGAEFVFQLAANASVPASTDDPDYDLNANTLGTYNVLKAIREKGNDTVLVYTSSAAVYGEPVYTPIDEKHPLNPASFYGASKMAGEGYCKAFYHIYGIKTVILRLFNIYGPRQPRYVMYDLLKKLSQNPRILKVLGTGKQKRDFTYVTDCVNAILLAATCSNATGKTINIGTGKAVDIKQLVNLILDSLRLSGKTTVIYSGKSWKGDVSTLLADINLSKSILNYKPTTSLETGLSTVVDYFSTHFRKRK